MASKRIRDVVRIDPDRVVSAALDAALSETSEARKHHPGRKLAAGAALAAAVVVGQRRLPRLAKAPLNMGLRKLGDLAHVDEVADAVRDRFAGLASNGGDDVYDEEDVYEDEDDVYDDEDDVYDDENEDEDDVYDDEDEEFEDDDFDDEPRDDAEDRTDDDEPPDQDDEEGEGPDDEPEDDDGPRDEGEAVEDDVEDDEPEDEEPEDDEPEDAVEGDRGDDEDPEAAPEEDGADPSDDEPEEEEEDEEIAARSVDLGVEPKRNGSRQHHPAPDLFGALRDPHRRPPVMRRGSRRLDPAASPPEPGRSDEPGSRASGSNGSKNTKSRAARS